jgi:hypothetical protein
MFVPVGDERSRGPRVSRAARVGFAAVASLAVGIVVGFASGYITAQRLLAVPGARQSAVPPAENAPPLAGKTVRGGDAVTPRSEPRQPDGESHGVPVGSEASTGDREPAPEPRDVPVAPPARSAVDREPAGASVDPRVPVATSLRVREGSIEILSRPSGADVALDGRIVGQTPLTIPRVEEGTHVIGIELSGFSRWATSVRVEAGKPTRVGASLTP